MIMHSVLKCKRLAAGVAVAVIAGLAVPAMAQVGPSPSRSAIEARKAVFTLIAANFRPLGEIVKGNKAYDAAEVQKQVDRLVFLGGFLNESFPDVSNTGLPDSKTKAEAWTNHDDFVKKIKTFQDASVALQKVVVADKSASDAFKAAVGAVGQECKGCHDVYKEK